MSKGPGRWQRAIIEALNERGEFILVDLLPDGYTRAQYVALIRAANQLRRRRAIWLVCGPRRQRGLKPFEKVVRMTGELRAQLEAISKS